jgi:hypothetical protein
VTSALECGRAVEIKLDWRRRIDHMQQHSGQHLISALAEQHFAWDTVSWNLGVKKNGVKECAREGDFSSLLFSFLWSYDSGPEKCSIDVACKKPIDAQQLIQLEEMANDQIKKQLQVGLVTFWLRFVCLFVCLVCLSHNPNSCRLV